MGKFFYAAEHFKKAKEEFYEFSKANMGLLQSIIGYKHANAKYYLLFDQVPDQDEMRDLDQEIRVL